MLLRLLTNPARRRWRRTLHNSIMRGQLRFGTCKMLASGTMLDLDHELRHARTGEAQTAIGEIMDRAKAATEEFLTSIMAITELRLREGETSAHRTDIGVQEYLRWRDTVDRLAEQARRVRQDRTEGARPRTGRSGWNEDVATVAVVAGAALSLWGESPETQLGALVCFTAGVLFLAEIVFRKLAPLLWLAGAAVLFWKGTVIGAWALSGQPWPAVIGVLLAWVMGALARRRVRTVTGT